MSLDIFTYRFVFSHEGLRSREYRGVRKVVREGLATIRSDGDGYFLIDPDNGEGFSRPRNYRDTAARLRDILRHRPLGRTIHVVTHKDGKGNAHVRFRCLQKPPVPFDIAGTQATKVWAGLVLRFFPAARFAGSVACKPNSDHAQGAALDHFDEPGQMEAARDLAIANATELKVKYVILYDRIWTAGPPHTNSSKGFHPYSGFYHHHVHVSFTDGVCGQFCTPGYGGCG